MHKLPTMHHIQEFTQILFFYINNYFIKLFIKSLIKTYFGHTLYRSNMLSGCNCIYYLYSSNRLDILLNLCKLCPFLSLDEKQIMKFWSKTWKKNVCGTINNNKYLIKIENDLFLSNVDPWFMVLGSWYMQGIVCGLRVKLFFIFVLSGKFYFHNKGS